MTAIHGWDVDRLGPTVLKLTTEIENLDFCRPFLLQSDEHFDHPGCNRSLLKHHLDQAKASNAGILKFGDSYDAMQGKFDPRGTKQDLLPQYSEGNYFDAIVDDYVDFHSAYAENIVGMGVGNHESSVKKRQETDLIGRTCQALRQHGGNAQAMGYAGWIIFQLKWGKRNYKTFRLFFHHGSGGEAPVTKGILQASKQAMYLPDADFVLSGHNHESWLFPITRTRLSDSGRTYNDIQYHIKTSSYKEEFLPLDGWHVEMGKPPKPVGSMIWMEFLWNSRTGAPRVNFSLTETD